MNKIYTALVLGAMPLLWSACTFHQTPEGLGNDPTDVDVQATVNLSISLPDADAANTDMIPAITDDYSHRFVVEATLPDGTTVDRQEFLAPVEDGKTDYMLPVKMSLHARQYKFMVWSDYVLTTPVEGEEDKAAVYNPAKLTPVMPAYAAYLVGNERKDCFRACVDLDLRPYANQWAAEMELDVELARPVGRYEIVTTDLGAFRQRILDGQISGNEFKVRIRYSSYLATGYNVLENVPKNYLSYMSFNQTVKASDWQNADKASMRLCFDYLLCNAGDEVTEIPVEIEIINENDVQVARSFVNIPVKQGYNTVVSGRFMTSSDEGGVTINPDYDGTIDINIGQL